MMCDISLCCADRFKSSLTSQLSCFCFLFIKKEAIKITNTKKKKMIFLYFSFFGVICGSCVNSIGSDLMDRRSLGSLSLYNRCVFYPFLGLLFLFFLFSGRASRNFEFWIGGFYRLFSFCMSAVVYWSPSHSLHLFCFFFSCSKFQLFITS